LPDAPLGFSDGFGRHLVLLQDDPRAGRFTGRGGGRGDRDRLVPWWRVRLAMTYNFDPDRWYESRLRLLDHRLDAGEINDAEHRVQREEIEARYEDMLRRLDGTYVLPGGGPGSD
jgi:hypothetical protein